MPTNAKPTRMRLMDLFGAHLVSREDELLLRAVEDFSAQPGMVLVFEIKNDSAATLETKQWLETSFRMAVCDASLIDAALSKRPKRINSTRASRKASPRSKSNS